jgi:hypothetical protein
MNRAAFRHIGGVVIADHGPVPLKAARGLVHFYTSEADRETAAASGECRRRAHALESAVAAASAWRRAAGWRDPDRADRQPPLDRRPW